MYLAEAKILASLDHPNIVPVHDVGRTEDGLCFVVSKLIKGNTLATKIKQSRPIFVESTELIATVADALHYAHRKGLVHRDVKPANILIDGEGISFLADFGLALKEEDFGKGVELAGTPAYMSPEQARGEGHRVDGRSDIFSLGVVFYELLTGRRPFRADSQVEFLEQITNVEVRPPRQIDDGIPKELERIVLKALSKRATERYTTAKDMADDLRYFLAKSEFGSLPATIDLPPVVDPDISIPSENVTSPISDSEPIKIIPKGLRSFDEHDANFFLELLPGPRDRDGLPDSIRFWKTRIEEADADNTFSVGLIYGPSGCGKSSLVKAGLLPRLSENVIAVYVEATAEETESRLLNGLRKNCPELEDNSNLKDTLAALRRGQGIPVGKKVLIVLDQFEQWLHAKKEEVNTELVEALRQCDGERVQCIVMVRDDFWMAVTRFMDDLEVDLLKGRNMEVVDLFDVRHANSVLSAFGRAFGVLPEDTTQTTKDQKLFLEQSVSGLADEGKIVSVQLALLAEMMKSKTWTPATLKEVGGTEGIGVAFLDETFSSKAASPKARYHQKAARAVLQTLLPESGTDIKGHMRSYGELLEASDYGSRPKDFNDLIHILDSEIRLITPTDPDGFESDDESKSKTQSGQKYYQLTHDYLVRSLRDWLTRKQKETRRRRAELLLADQAAMWIAKPENRFLPSLMQWLRIRCLTPKKNWLPPQRKMMAKAGRYHVMRGLLVAVLLILIGWGAFEANGRIQSRALRDRLLDANTADVPTIVNDMAPYRRWIDPLLRTAYQEAEANKEPRQQLHASIALLPEDSSQVEYLYGRLLNAQPHEVPAIREALFPHKVQLLNKLWTVVETPDRGKESQRLRAAAALAKYDTKSDKWAKVQQAVADNLVSVPAVYLAPWMDSLRPVRKKLLTPLSDIYRNTGRPDVERFMATDILADYSADDTQKLADLLMDADDKQFAVIYPKFKEREEQGWMLLTGEIDKKLSFDLPSSDGKREKLAIRQANAAVALLKMNRPEKVWPLLKHSPDPRVRSYLLHRFAPLGVVAWAIVKRLDEEPDITIRRALVLSLGAYGEKELLSEVRKALLPKLQEMYRTDADPGLHGASEWLLRSWKQEAWLKNINEKWANNKEEREKKIEGIKYLVRKDKENTRPQWFVNGQGQTMVVIPGPVEFVMGSPPTEVGRRDYERQHKRRIGRTFALAAKSVTLEQYRRFDKGYALSAEYTRMADLPVVGLDWYRAASYCNWLSQQEGIPEEEWCYETEPKEKTGPRVKVVKLRENYLSLSGYRLPTEAEMEYATRAGALTSRYFGETEELLSKYAWYDKNSQEKTWPVGSLKPNDLGLFDMQGNVFTWCTEIYKSYPGGTIKGEAIDDKEDGVVLNSTRRRVLRGGSFGLLASYVRSAKRNGRVPTYRVGDHGFRPSRTLPLGGFPGQN